MPIDGLNERIKAVRKGSGLTQEVLARELGIATITLRQYESGRREPSLPMIIKIADATGVVPIDLIVPSDHRKFVEKAESGELFKERFKTLDDSGFIDLGSDTFVTASDGTFIKVPTETLEAALLVSFSNLNDDGKEIALERIIELTEIPKYKKERQSE